MATTQTSKSTSTKKTGVSSSNGNASKHETELSNEVSALRDDISAISERLAKIADAGVKSAKSRGNATHAAAREQGEELVSTLQAQAHDLESRTAETVREKPLQALGLAVGIGFLAALVMRRS